ncbi:MAG: hypothetical protein ACTSR4_02980, partial [Candidatus Hodarchaeales archaeon]
VWDRKNSIGQITEQSEPLNKKRKSFKPRLVTYARVSSNNQKSDIYLLLDYSKHPMINAQNQSCNVSINKLKGTFMV